MYYIFTPVSNQSKYNDWYQNIALDNIKFKILKYKHILIKKMRSQWALIAHMNQGVEVREGGMVLPVWFIYKFCQKTN